MHCSFSDAVLSLLLIVILNSHKPHTKFYSYMSCLMNFFYMVFYLMFLKITLVVIIYSHTLHVFKVLYHLEDNNDENSRPEQIETKYFKVCMFVYLGLLSHDCKSILTITKHSKTSTI